MPILGAGARIPVRPRRVLVAGTSGSGKTTLARRVAEILDLPAIEIDALYHGPGWVPRPTFEEDVRRFADGPEWITEWQYGAVRAYLAARADLVIWLDLPRRRVMTQVIRRTVRRSRSREILWNGNVEPPLRTFLTDPDHLVRWAWRTHARTGSRVVDLSLKRPELAVVRLRSRAEIARWVAGLASDT
jgi:adenylate kinase family enzyme